MGTTQLDHLPPHANAEVHKKIMARLSTLTPQDFFKASVRAGVHKKDGSLSKPYRQNGSPSEKG